MHKAYSLGRADCLTGNANGEGFDLRADVVIKNDVLALFYNLIEQQTTDHSQRVWLLVLKRFLVSFAGLTQLLLLKKLLLGRFSFFHINFH